MFSGSWSANVAPSPSPIGNYGASGSTGTWSPNVVPGSGTYSSWGAPTSGDGQVSNFISSYSAPQAGGESYSWFSSPGYALPSGIAARGALGEGGPYTELDYPEMRFLRAGENPTELLSSLRQRQAGKPGALAQALVIGLVALALFK